MSKRLNLIGKTFNRLHVIEFSHIQKEHSYFKCKCVCGKEIIVSGDNIKRGEVKSCGCLFREALSKRNSTHGLSKTRLYTIWKHIISRCENKKSVAYKNYGGRGISICAEWRCDFKKFHEWSINNGYNDNLSIDRINNNGNYEPSNCRWATSKIQSNNTRKNKKITYKGKTQSLSNWCSELNVSCSRTTLRLKRGWDFKSSVEIKDNVYGNKNIKMLKKIL